MKPSERDTQFAAFVTTHRLGLVKTATMWCHGDSHRAEDLVQTALSRVFVAWPRIAAGAALAYTRRALYSALIDESRRPVWRRERVTAELPDGIDPHASELGAPGYGGGVAAQDSAVFAALAALPRRMRAAVVLRHLDGLSVAETADVLGCSQGTVKSQTARGLDHLRTALDTADPPDERSGTSPPRPHVVTAVRPLLVRPHSRKALR